MRVAGIMSGTSLDGIDVAICDIARGVEMIAFRSKPYPRAVRSALLAISNAQAHTGEISRLNFLLGELYAAALRETCARSKIGLGSVKLIGCHGQTIFHSGTGGHTLQIGEASVIAERTRIGVISNFRERDMAAGGKGAPLVPFVDYRLFRHATRGRVALNIGGIANITLLPPGAPADKVIAFDTGPGNMVIDALVTRRSNGRASFDRGGAIARRGHADQDLVNRLLADPYYRAKPPKTAGREQYGAEFVSKLEASGGTAEDLISTATELTARSIVEGIRRFGRFPVNDLIAAGGGIHNRTLMDRLRALLAGTRVVTTAEFGIDPDAKEAVAFAVLAYESARGRPSNLPSATGASRPVVLGKRTPGSAVRR